MQKRTPTCVICRNEMGEEDDHCPTCGAITDRADLKPVSDALNEATWEIVRTYSTNVEAEIVAGRLRHEGIPAIVLSQVDSTRNLTVGALAIAKVFVRDEDRTSAEEVLARPGEDPESSYKDDTTDV